MVALRLEVVANASPNILLPLTQAGHQHLDPDAQALVL